MTEEKRTISIEANALHLQAKAQWAETRALILQDDLIQITRERDELLSKLNSMFAGDEDGSSE